MVHNTSLSAASGRVYTEDTWWHAQTLTLVSSHLAGAHGISLNLPVPSINTICPDCLVVIAHCMQLT